jgi:hypothetical protein
VIGQRQDANLVIVLFIGSPQSHRYCADGDYDGQQERTSSLHSDNPSTGGVRSTGSAIDRNASLACEQMVGKQTVSDLRVIQSQKCLFHLCKPPRERSDAKL